MSEQTADSQAVHLAVYDTLADWEPGYAIAHINKPDWQKRPGRYRAVTVGATADPITTAGGIRIIPDMALTDLNPAESAMLILPGSDSWAPTNSGDNAAFARVAAEFLTAGVPVAAICGATLGLAAAGLLNDRAHTSNAPEFVAMAPGYESELYLDAPAVTDRGLITATALAPTEFARHIFAELDLYTPEVLEAWVDFFGHRNPAGFHRLMASSGAGRPSA
ncbi:MAG: DJ-1/PfpI family protein [Pseudonocardiaceae bacterium]